MAATIQTSPDLPSALAQEQASPSVNSANPAHWATFVDQLQRVIEEQYQHVDEMLEHYAHLLADAEGVHAGWAELKQQCADWETYREKASRELNEEYQQLAQAWEEIELQQRLLETSFHRQASAPNPSERLASLLTDSLVPIAAPELSTPRPSGSRISENRPAVTSPAVTSPAVTSLAVTRPAVTRPAASCSLDIRDSWTPHLNEAAALQFQQMQRQINQHVADAGRK